MAELTKGEFITNILATPHNIAAWKAFRTAQTELSIAVNEAWESSNNVILTSPFVQGLVNALVPSVLDTAALSRFNNEILVQAGMTTVNNNKRYHVTIPAGTVDHFAYCSNYASGDISVSGLSGNFCIVEAPAGIFNCPTAEEI